AGAALVIGWGLYVLLAAALRPYGVSLHTDKQLWKPFSVPHMSVSTASIFVVAGLALLALLGRSNRLSRLLLSVSAWVIGLTSLPIVFAYAYQVDLLTEVLAPHLQDGVALLTASAFLLLDVGLICARGPSRFPLRPFVGPSPRAVLLRSFLPAV